MRVIRNCILAPAAICATLGLAGAARAAPPPLSIPSSGNQTNPDGTQGYSGFLGDLNRTNFLLGDLFGLRTVLAKYGISLAIQETSEVQGNPTGGVHRGADYDGLTQVILQLDTQRAFGWYGGLLNISALQIHGRSLSADNLESLQTSSGIQADRATRLWEAWYDQKFLDEDRADIKFGQQSVDQEFIFSPNGGYFVNTMFGWPLVPSVDLPGGGPAYPLSDLGIRLRYRPINPVTILAGVFNGNPARTLDGDAQRADASGTSFALNGGILAFAELQYTYPALGSLVYPGEGAPLGHTYKIGVWYDTEPFADQRLTSLSGAPLSHRGDYSIYAVADQMVWRDSAFPNRSVSLFGRVMGTPEADRNLADFSANGGVVYHTPFITRPDDTIGLGFGYAHVSRQAQAASQDAAQAAPPGTYAPILSSETFVELTYQYQVHPWWQIQPDLQYVFNPGGGITDPSDPTKRVGDEFVLGLRTNILF
jgi:porin